MTMTFEMSDVETLGEACAKTALKCREGFRLSK